MVAIALPERPEPRPYLPLGRRIAAARNAAGLNQREAAKVIGISEGYVPQIEGGKRRPDPDILRLIARQLPVSYEELAVLAGYANAEPDDDPSPDDPELDLLFRQLKEEDLPASDLRYVKETIRLALQMRRERKAAGEPET